MITNGYKLVLLIGALFFCMIASADTRVNEVWTCQLNEGKKMDDIRAANSKWVKFVNANIEGGDIGSSIATSIVGNSAPGSFVYIDSYPNLEAWTKSKSVLEGNAEGEAITAALDGGAECSNNRLYSAESS
jgi:hypothetical protein